MGVTILRLIFMILSAAVGYHIALGIDREYGIYGLLLGIAFSLTVILIEIALSRVTLRILVGGILGLIGGSLLAKIIASTIGALSPRMSLLLHLLLMGLFGYFGIVFGIKKGESFQLSKVIRYLKGQEGNENTKILDTSVIIDGRIADICETGFLEGMFIIPQFILRELQHIADSSDPLKRARGRRGLDILHKIQKMAGVDVKIIEEDFPKLRDVDSKLVALAKRLNAKIITNDFNLNKVAELQGVTVLNINELTNAVKPVVLPGEGMKVFILKEGKEINQGVAYLDDGTMVVVENARKLIGKTVDVIVTSVLQTTAGRMIFTKLKEEAEREEYSVASMR
ncbi:MAG: PIN domain-containing protein [Nitrospirota bacterium]